MRKKNPAAVALAKRRWAGLTAAQRSEIQREAALRRWARVRAEREAATLAEQAS